MSNSYSLHHNQEQRGPNSGESEEEGTLHLEPLQVQAKKYFDLRQAISLLDTENSSPLNTPQLSPEASTDGLGSFAIPSSSTDNINPLWTNLDDPTFNNSQENIYLQNQTENFMLSNFWSEIDTEFLALSGSVKDDDPLQSQQNVDQSSRELDSFPKELNLSPNKCVQPHKKLVRPQKDLPQPEKELPQPEKELPQLPRELDQSQNERKCQSSHVIQRVSNSLDQEGPFRRLPSKKTGKFRRTVAYVQSKKVKNTLLFLCD